MNNDIQWQLLQSKLSRLHTVEVVENLLALGIESIVLKGVAIERFYPNGTPRPSVDIDVAVAPEDFERAKHSHLEGKLGKHNIDLHEGLRHFDTRNWNDVFERTSVIELEEGRIRVLCDEDQLRVVCVHWLTDGGEKKHRLWDVYYVVKNRRKDFDWSFCLDANGVLRRRWILCSIGLAHRYLELAVNDLPFSDEDIALPDWLVATVEQRWDDEVSYAPLDSEFANPMRFLRQLKRRFPPNALMATVALECDFDKGHRLPIQLRYMADRFLPSASRVLMSFKRTFWR